MGRCSVSSEAYGRFNKKEDFVPIVIPKTEEVKAQIRDKLNECFMFNALEDHEVTIVIDAMKVEEISSGTVIINQGDDGDVLYVIGEGQLDCHRTMVRFTLTSSHPEKHHSI